MSNKLKKTHGGIVKESTQYGLTFGIIASMLYFAGFPMFVIFFFGVFAYFIWRTFSSPNIDSTRHIFDFYISANSILRNDDRKWFGFEINETIEHGEKILSTMQGAPPLVYFSLGALYFKIGRFDHAERLLSYVVENELADEAAYQHPSGELRRYVNILRKIEQEPTEAPKTTSAIRSLERMRRREGQRMLAESRAAVSLELKEKAVEEKFKPSHVHEGFGLQYGDYESDSLNQSAEPIAKPSVRRKGSKDENSDGNYERRKPISEVLHDIYDKNVQ